MDDSILNSTKKYLGLAADYHDFDMDVMMNINAAFATLNQIGVGPLHGFMIEDETATWDSFLMGDNRFNSAKLYVYIKVRMIFDPPTTSGLLQAMQSTITELESRLNIAREYSIYGLPTGGGSYTPPITDPIFDGGGPGGVVIPTPTPDTVYDGGSP